MGQAIGTVLRLALGVAISPIPIVAVVVTLATPRGKPNGPAFVFGWIVGIAVVGTAVLLVLDGISASNSGRPKTWVSVLKLGARAAPGGCGGAGVAGSPWGSARSRCWLACAVGMSTTTR